MKARTSLSLLLGGVLAVGSGFVSAVAVADGDVQPANVEAQPGPLDTCCTPSGADMPTVGGNLGNQHYSALTQIKRQNLHRLGPVWRTHVSAVEPATDDVGRQWYEGLLGNANYTPTEENQPGEVVFVNARDVSTAGLPQRWDFVDEWYNSIPFPTDVNFLAVVDESTLPEGPGRPGQHPGHGDFHPVSWCQYYDGGRSWVTTLGHGSDAFRDPAATDFPGAAEFQAHIIRGSSSPRWASNRSARRPGAIERGCSG